ncbi:MAG TPA: hypothetical protein VFZ11_10980 [Gemmatimonadaceae bacterium]
MSDPMNPRPVSRRAAACAIAAGAAGLAAALARPHSLLALAAPHTGAPHTGAPHTGAARVGATSADLTRGVTLRIGVASSDGDDPGRRSRERGIRMGAEEASRAAAMLGGAIELREGRASELLAGGIDALVGGSAGECASPGALAAAAEVVYIDTACGVPAAGAAGAAGARRFVFHLAPGRATRRLTMARATGPGTLELWHPALRRFGAAQLNARYRARFDAPMDSPAWAGWLAVKILWESASRLDAARGDTLAEWLVSPRARFDGHKGRALSFDDATHELRQPLYVVRAATAGEPEIEEIALDDAADAGAEGAS